MAVNSNIEILIIGNSNEKIKSIVNRLRKSYRLPGEKILFSHKLFDGIHVLRNNGNIEMVVLYTDATKTQLRTMLVALRRITIAHIIVITLFESLDDIADFYDYGADTCIPPSLGSRATVAFFEAFYRRHRMLPSIGSMRERGFALDMETLTCGDFIIDPARRTVEREGTLISLTSKEFDLLYFFAKNEGIIFTQEQIFDLVWKYPVSSNSDLTSRIMRLRKKIEPNPKKPIYIKTKHGAGYYFTSSK